MAAIQWLVSDAQPNDSLFFHCEYILWALRGLGNKMNFLDSGHGGQTKDLDGDEADGYDEGVRIRVDLKNEVYIDELLQ